MSINKATVTYGIKERDGQRYIRTLLRGVTSEIGIRGGLDPDSVVDETGRTVVWRLLDIGREIQVRLRKLNQTEAKATDMVDSINCLLGEAEKFCSPDGFAAFKQRYCPELGRSRLYELLAVAQGRKTVEQVRAAGRARVAKHRANKQNGAHVETDQERRDREECIALAEKAKAADPEFAKWLSGPKQQRTTGSAEISIEQRRAQNVALDVTDRESVTPLPAEDMVDYIGQQIEASVDNAITVRNVWSRNVELDPEVADSARDDVVDAIRNLIAEWQKALDAVEAREMAENHL